MRAYISECIHAITPFHVPKTTVVFPRHPRIAQALFNHQDASKQWATRKEPTCKCDLIKKYAPKTPTFCGHVAARGIELTHFLSSLEKQIASGSVTDTFFPDKAQIRTQFLDAGVAPTRCQAHREALLRSSSRFGKNTSPRYKPGTTGKPWTASNSKHEAPFGTPRTTTPARQSAFAPLCIIACLRAPLVIHKCFRKFLARSRNKLRRSKRQQNATFNVDIRGRFGTHPSSHERMHYRSAKKILRRDDPSSPLSTLSCDRCWRPPLDFFTGYAALPFLRPSPREMCTNFYVRFVNFFQFGTTEKLHCRNQDLAGFFNSISQSQFLHAWRITLEFYRQRHGAQADTTFSVNLKEQAQQLRVFRGRRRARPLGKSPSGAKTYQPSYDMPLHCSISEFQLETSANALAHLWAPPSHPPYAGWSLLRKRKSGGAHSTSAAPT